MLITFHHLDHHQWPQGTRRHQALPFSPQAAAKRSPQCIFQTPACNMIIDWGDDLYHPGIIIHIIIHFSASAWHQPATSSMNNFLVHIRGALKTVNSWALWATSWDFYGAQMYTWPCPTYHHHLLTYRDGWQDLCNSFWEVIRQRGNSLGMPFAIFW